MLKRMALFVALLLPIFMIGVDLLIIGVAIAPMAKAFQTPLSTSQWFTTAYAMGYATFVGASGRLSDFFGQKKFLILAILLFSASSLIISLASHANLVIVARFLQGISAGMMATTTISIVMTSFTSKQKQKLWIGGLVGMAGLGMVLAPPIGGLMINYWSWRSVFIINIPIGIITTLAAFYAIKPYPPQKVQAFDFLGLLLLVLTISSLILLISQGATWGLTSWLFIIFTIVFFVAGTLLIINERRAHNPLLDLSLFKIANFTAANLTGFSIYFILLGQILIWGIYLKKSLGLDSLQIGLRFLPIGLMMAFGSLVLGKLIKTISDKTLMIAGSLLSLLSSIWFAFLPINLPYWMLAIGFACFGLGFFLINSISTNVALSFLPQPKITLGSSMCMMFRWLGGSIGSAMASLVFIARQRMITNPTLHQGKQALMQNLHSGLISTQWLFAAVALFTTIVSIFYIKIKASLN